MSERPASVTIVVVLTWVVAILAIIGGLFALFSPSTYIGELGWSNSQVRLQGAITVIVGLITAILANMLGSGSKFARLLGSLLMILRLIGGALLALLSFGSVAFWVGITSALLALVVLWMLWNARAGAFFNHATLTKG